MATFSSVSRQHVLAAVADHDSRGSDEEFCRVYGFEPLEAYALVHDGRRYDARALLAVAHRSATGRLATPEDFHAGMGEAVAILRRRGFEVTEPRSATVTRPAPARTRVSRAAASRSPGSSAPRRTSSRAEAPAPAICPTCSLALPATGVCDDCG